ncbi:MAG: AAA family ATPase [Pseudomonadales bacterium]|nr:AAA family ATPase [Pseudomonadales bacterium]
MDSKIIIETIQAGCSGIHIQGQDVIRIDEEIEKVAAKINFKIKEWNLGYGWVDPKSKRAFSLDKGVSLYEDLKLIADDDPTGKIYIIKNAYSALNNDFRSVARMQHELLRIKKYFSGKSVILLVAKESILFSEIIDLLVTVPCPPLSSRQAEDIFNTVISEKKIVISTAIKSNLISIFSGMERELVERIIQTLINHYGKLFSKDAVNDAIRLKKTHFAQSGLLELVDSTIGIEQIGGLEQLKGWLRNKKQIVDDLTGAQRLGIPAPKGVLLAGMPGCGKSMSAKAAASLFNVPLFRLDIGSLMGKYVGQSEANMKTALQIAEKASPCVLWIDELEKAFSGVNGAGGSTEITTRLFGYFLTWMQEKPGPVFVIATANDITTIPPELLRRGRFDEIFYIDLPNDRERRQIFEVKTKSLKLTLHRGDLNVYLL